MILPKMRRTAVSTDFLLKYKKAMDPVMRSTAI